MSRKLTEDERARRSAAATNKKAKEQAPLLVAAGLIETVSVEDAIWTRRLEDAKKVEYLARLPGCSESARALYWLEVWCRIRERRNDLDQEERVRRWTCHWDYVRHGRGVEYFLELWSPRPWLR